MVHTTTYIFQPTWSHQCCIYCCLY